MGFTCFFPFRCGFHLYFPLTCVFHFCFFPSSCGFHLYFPLSCSASATLPSSLWGSIYFFLLDLGFHPHFPPSGGVSFSRIPLALRLHCCLSFLIRAPPLFSFSCRVSSLSSLLFYFTLVFPFSCGASSLFFPQALGFHRSFRVFW